MALETEHRRVAAASAIGTTIEWYDFYIYGTAAALVLNELFFPKFSPTAGTLAVFATFAVGFLARPVGGALFGHLGDTIGRRSALVITLTLMGVTTTIMGLLPTYDTLGMWAAVLLVALRFVQGLAVGGEWGNAVTIVVEYAPSGRRGLYAAFPQIGAALGLVLAAGAFALVGALMSDASFEAWGWRLPFLASVVLVGIGLLIRLRIAESPLFEELRQRDEKPRSPLAEVVRRDARNVLLAGGTFIASPATFYIVSVFALGYATDNFDVSRGLFLNAVLIAAAIECFTLPLFGALTDRVGRKPVYAFGLAFTAIWAFPAFLLIGTGNPVALTLAIVLALAVGHAAQYAPAASLLTELFETERRCSGASLGYQLGGLLGGGFSPLVAAALVGAAGTAWWPAAGLVVTAAMLSGACLLGITETQRRSLHDSPDAPPGPGPSDALTPVAEPTATR